MLLFSVVFGLALNGAGPAGAPVFQFIERLSRVLFGIVGIVMRTAPIGAFGAMAATIGSFGVGTLAQLGTLIATFYVTAVAFVSLVLANCLVVRRRHLAPDHVFQRRTVRGLRHVVFRGGDAAGHGQAGAAWGVAIDRRAGDPRRLSFNLDGSAIYQTIAVGFIAQATNTPFRLGDQLVLLAVLMLTSKGVAGVAGAALVVLAGTLSAAGRVPVAGVALVLGIHRFMGEAMAVTNTIGNCVAAIAIGKRCDQLDQAKLRTELRLKSTI